MKVKNTILLIAATITFTFQIAFADQLTITFTNPVPAAPANCGDTWSEQGVEIKLIQCHSFNYGNGNLYFLNGKLNINLSELGRINEITTSFTSGCCIEFYYLQENVTIYSESFTPGYDNLVISEFVNNNYPLFDSMTISSTDSATTLFDITIDYTPICESEPISNVRNGDVYLNDACYGVIMTSPSGNCFRAKVGDNGMLFTEPVDCP